MLLILTSGAVIIAGATIVGLGVYLSSRFLYHPTQGFEETREDGVTKGEITEEFLKLPKIDFTVCSEFGYPISGFAIRGKTQKTIVFAHGVSWSRWGMVKYMPYFIKRGWNVICYDHRAHGLSGGKLITFGFYEKHDLSRVISWALERFPQTSLLGVGAESMGAAVMLQSVPLDGRPDFYLSDSAFSSMKKLMRHHLTQYHIPSFIHKPVLFCADTFSNWKAGFRLTEIEPVACIQNSEKPFFFSHCTDDAVAPVSMLSELSASVRGICEVFVCKGGAHAQALMKDKIGYEKALDTFLKKVLSAQKKNKLASV